MAGSVSCDRFVVPGTSVLDVVARVCAYTERFGERCMTFDPHSGETKVCPYWYGMKVEEGTWHLGEARSLTEARAWLSTDQADSARRYSVRCLAADQNCVPGVRPGR